MPSSRGWRSNGWAYDGRTGFPAVINVEQAPDSVTVDDITYKHLLPNAKLGSMPVHEYLDLAATSLARFVLDYKPSVLHIGSGHRGFETALVGRAVAEWFGIPWLYEVRSFFETTWTSDKRYMERAPYFHQRHATESRCMRAADFVVTLSGPMRDEIIERHGIDVSDIPFQHGQSGMRFKEIPEPLSVKCDNAEPLAKQLRD